MIAHNLTWSLVGREVTLNVVATEDNPLLWSAQGWIAWGDGNTSTLTKSTRDVNTAAHTWVATHTYATHGTYTVVSHVQNFLNPVPNEVEGSFQLFIAGPPSLVVSPTSWVSVGPILPKDNGYPNASQWNFSVGYDTELIGSSLKLILTTTKGERLMEPDFGTNLKAILFSGDLRMASVMARQEIQQAISIQEPRVSVNSIQVFPTSGRTGINVMLDCVEKPNGKPVQLGVVFNS